MSKQVVHYYEALFPIQVGESAVVRPIDHPDEVLVSNYIPAHTTAVVSHNAETGDFETRNSQYVKVLPPFDVAQREEAAYFFA